jgi:nicotinamide-nucleotide amidase
MNAEIVSIGTELLLGQIVDTDAAFLSQRLAEIGVGIYRRATVGDNLQRVVSMLQESLDRADILVTIGGLGPTEDDLTREAIAQVLNEPLVQDEAIAAHLQEMFARRNFPLTGNQLRQAMRPACARPIPNPHGTAPGLVAEKNGKIVFALPGPRNEFEPMVLNHVIPPLAKKTGGAVIRSRVLRFCGIGEGALEEQVKDLLQTDNPTVAPLAQLGEVHLRITARASSAEESTRLIEIKEQALRERAGKYIYGIDNTTLEEAVVNMLRENKQSLATAESCTGGLLSSRITDIPGSSDVYLGGVVSYSNALKISLLGVPEEVLNSVGAVSEETAQAMAEGARQRFGAYWSISITGIAGPGGGTEEKPVGLVYIALSDPQQTVVRRYDQIGDRKTIKWRSTQLALTMLYRQMMKAE